MLKLAMVAASLSCAVAAVHSAGSSRAAVLPTGVKCTTSQFTCDDGGCIPDTWFCDGIIDCSDSSDEPDGCEYMNNSTITTTTLPTTTEEPDTTTPPPGTCNLPYILVSGRCLVVEAFVSGTYGEMNYRCMEYGGHPIELKDANFLYDVVEFLKLNELTVDDYWIGGRKEASVTDYRWMHTNTTVQLGTPYWGLQYYNYEYVQEPLSSTSEMCMFLDSDRSYFFASQSCTEVAGVICERI